MAKKAKTENSEQEFASIDAGCPHYFGYLRERPREEGIPEECLTCEKVVECMLSELKSPQPEVEQTQTTGEEGKQSLEQVAEEIAEEETAKGEIVEEEKKEKVELEAEAQPKIGAQLSEDQFVVKDMGILYAMWTNTVRIPKGILSSWGKVKEVILETMDGKLEICKVAALEGLEGKVIEVPDKVQQNLGIKKGDVIKVRPCI
ncbi:MAG: hypothetical protein QXW82_01250 [Candidatus Bathyarchaeia archaeon]